MSGWQIFADVHESFLSMRDPFVLIKIAFIYRRFNQFESHLQAHKRIVDILNWIWLKLKSHNAHKNKRWTFAAFELSKFDPTMPLSLFSQISMVSLRKFFFSLKPANWDTLALELIREVVAYSYFQNVIMRLLICYLIPICGKIR